MNMTLRRKKTRKTFISCVLVVPTFFLACIHRQMQASEPGWTIFISSPAALFFFLYHKLEIPGLNDTFKIMAIDSQLIFIAIKEL